MPKYHFKEGDTVRQKDNLDLQMTVSRILRESKEIIERFDKDNNPIKKQVVRMIGIECHWWEIKENQSKELRTYKFHSTELVPETIAIKGKEEVKKWLTEQISK